MPERIVHTLAITETRLSLHQTVLESLAKRTGAHPSWIEMLDRLPGELAKAAGVVVDRIVSERGRKI